MIFPWQSEAWGRLNARRAALPHALLLRGRRGIGKRHLARIFAQSLLCQTPAGDQLPCGRCQACHWLEQGNHPDLMILEPEADVEPVEPTEDAPPPRRAEKKAPSKFILIHQLRALQEWVVMSSHRGGYRIAIIVPAEAMNAATANALLKTLEEPPPNTLLLLVSHDSARLLPTIMSRCQRVDLGVPDRDAAKRWLEGQGVADAANQLALAGGTPLDVLENPGRLEVARVLAGALSTHGRDPFALAEAVATIPLDMLVDLLQKWGFDLASLIAGQAPRYFISLSTPLGEAARHVANDALMTWLSDLAGARSLVSHPLNSKMVCERLFTGYRDAVWPAGTATSSH